MSKVNTIKIKQSTVLALLMLTILVMGVSIPMRKAHGNTYYSPGYTGSYNDPTITYSQPYYNPPVVAPVPKTVYVPSQTTVYRQVNTYPENVRETYNNTTTTENNTTVEEKYGSLAASAAYGDNTFAPSGLTQWILLAILILVIVILARKIFGASNRYHSSPLKHA
jgi:hypothetical protein